MSEAINWRPQPEIWEQFKREGQILFKPGILIARPTLQYVETIYALLHGEFDGIVEKALLDVKQSEIAEAIGRQQAFVAFDLERDEMIGYQAMGEWPQYGLFEPRSAKVHKLWRGQQINTIMKQLAMQSAHEQRPDWSFMGFTEDGSGSRNILTRMGYNAVDMNTIREKLPDLANPCPVNCFIKNNHSCGCQVYIHNPNEGKN